MVEIGRARSKPDAAPARSHDAERTRRDILEIASREFARNGLSGARVDEIAARTRSSKRMIYYYFGDKEGLYLRALEDAYCETRASEAKLDTKGLPPVEALRQLVEFTFDHHHRHEDFIRLVMIENIHHGAHLDQSKLIKRLNAGAIEKLEAICRRGKKEGLFRDDVDPLELHWLISALSFFNVSNRATFSRLFGDRLFRAKGQKALRQQAVKMVLHSALKPDRLRHRR